MSCSSGLTRCVILKVSVDNKGRASAAIDRLIARSKAGRATYKQARLLGRFGLDARDLTFKGASQLIDSIKRNGWRVPAGVGSAA